MRDQAEAPLVLSSEVIHSTAGQVPELEAFDVRIPRWSFDKLTRRSCPFCSGYNPPVFLRPDRLPVTHCKTCGTWYVCSLPPEEEITKLYQGYWFSFRPKDLSQEYANGMLANPKWLAQDIRLDRLSALVAGLGGKRLLEIGCGAGELLIAAHHRGAKVFGNDISAESCDFVENQLKIPVLRGSITQEQSRNEFRDMDVVVMSDLIEHPSEPVAVFTSALQALKPGGLLLMLTPNGGAAGDGLHTARDWIGFRVDLEHLQYLSTQTINFLASKYDCQIEHLETLGFPSLEGLDRPPLPVSAKQGFKAQVKKIKIVRKIVHLLRSMDQIRKPKPVDIRCGTYHLLAILRKRM